MPEPVAPQVLAELGSRDGYGGRRVEARIIARGHLELLEVRMIVGNREHTVWLADWAADFVRDAIDQFRARD